MKGIVISDLHKVLDVDHGHIRRSFAVQFRTCFDNGLIVNILSFIGKGSRAKREDAMKKVAEFNQFLADNLPQYKNSPFLPVPLYICDHRTNSGGKLSTIQQWYEQDDSDPRIIGVIDDAPDICDEVEAGNVRAYRIYGGSRRDQLHDRTYPVFRNFPEAVGTLISDFNSGVVPMRQFLRFSRTSPRGDRREVSLGLPPRK